jgi:hypothetical protein
MAKSTRYDLSDDEIDQLEIPTGIPLVYVLDERLVGMPKCCRECASTNDCPYEYELERCKSDRGEK